MVMQLKSSFLLGIMGDCVIEVSNVQIGIIGLYSLEDETFVCFFFETSGTNHPVTRRHIPEGRRAQVRTNEWEKEVGCTKMAKREVKNMGPARIRERE